MSIWHKGSRGSWWREREGVRITIERDYLALTRTTWWLIRGVAALEGRSFQKLANAKRVADIELARLAGPAAVALLTGDRVRVES